MFKHFFLVYFVLFLSFWDHDDTNPQLIIYFSINRLFSANIFVVVAAAATAELIFNIFYCEKTHTLQMMCVDEFCGISIGIETNAEICV